jgi:hypothetical protein
MPSFACFEPRPWRRSAYAAAVAVGLGLGLGAGWSPAVAHADASSTREIIIDDFETEHTVNNCTGDLGTLNRTFTGFAHTTVRPDGSVHFNAVINADDATFIPDDPTLPVFSGREQVHVSDTTNGSSATFTFMIHLWVESPDGTKAFVMEMEHVTVSATGNSVVFEKPVLVCP